MNPTHGLNREQWFAILGRMAAALGEGAEVRLCLIGSAACLFGGMDGRTSRDLHIWTPASDYDRAELERAALAAGLLFDPRTSLEPDLPYLQLVDQIPTELDAFEPVFLERMGRLRLYRPPIENLVVAKLIRCDERDLSDIRFLLARFRPDPQEIHRLIATLTPGNRDRASENSIYLTVLES